MIRIITSQQTKALDEYTIANEPVLSIDLMERACNAFVRWFTHHIETPKKIAVICGPGNNGGDGLGIARLLKEWNYNVKVWLVRAGSKTTPDFDSNLERLKSVKVEIEEFSTASNADHFEGRPVLIDAIFGSGLSKPVEGIFATAIDSINKSNALVVSVDIPSGLQADAPSTGEIVRADYTVTFQSPKLSFMFPDAYRFTGDWITVDIGLNKSFNESLKTDHFLLSETSVKKILRKRKKFDHKGTFGHALLIAGSYGKIGAALLAAKACLRSGAGLTTLHIPSSAYGIVQATLPDAMVSLDAHEHYFSTLPALNIYQAIGIGPGIGQQLETHAAIEAVLKTTEVPLVIDADAINILSHNKPWLSLIPRNSILTPHPKEFERLVGKWSNDFERLALQKQLASDVKSIIILKGAHSSIATPSGEVFFNATGNPGMAKGGSGDVLTGVLTALLAQSYSATESAILGVYLHGLAGDMAAYEKSQFSMLASDLIEYIPEVFKKLGR